MWRPTASDLGLVLGAVVVAGAVAQLRSDGPAEVLFFAVLLAASGWAVREALRAAAVSRDERRQEVLLARVRPAVAAMSAVQEERRRLSLEIAQTLRQSLADIKRQVGDAGVAGDLDERLQHIQAATQHATSELRRQLGLLRSALPDAAEPRRPSARPPRTDVTLGVAMTCLGLVESVAYPRTEQWPDWSAWSVLVTALAAATVTGRTVLLGASSVLCAALLGAGSVLGAPVVDGFWLLGSVCVLLWSGAARARTPADICAGLLLTASVAITRVRDSPDNAAMAMVLVGASITGGLAVRLVRARGEAARQRADARRVEVEHARRVALDAERSRLAHELHDVASHAIGVISLHCGAAAVSWPRDPQAAARSLEVIRTTAGTALTEIDRLVPGAAPARSADDLRALVRRIRSTGTRVDVVTGGDVPPEVMHVVHRVLQESLTNAVRHAPGARVLVDLQHDDSGTTVCVTDDGPGPGTGEGAGFGLTGLAERVQLAGGTFTHGPGPGGRGFRIIARLPVDTSVRA